MSTLILLTTCDLFKPGLGGKVDITPPKVAVSSPDQNSYVRGTLTIKGTASDDLSLASLTVQYTSAGGSVTKTAAVTKGAWQIDIPTGAGGPDNLPDGEQRVSVTATDGSGKQVEALLIAYVDNVAPTVVVTVPQGYDLSKPTMSDYIDIKGEVWDPSPIQNVTVQLLSSGGTVLATKQADGTNTWSVRFDITPFPNLQDYRYVVEVTDKAGNQNSYYYHSADIWALLPVGKLYPTTDEIGKMDQAGTGTGPASGILFADLYARRLGPPRAVYADFSKNNDATIPVVHYSNLDPALPITSNVIGTKVPINGYVNPGPAGNTVIGGSVKAWIVPWSATPSFPGWPTTGNVDPADVHWNPIGTSVTYQIEPKLAGAYVPSGRYIVRVQAGATGASAETFLDCNFLVDSGAPRIDATTLVPLNLSLVRRTTFASGPLSGQTGIEIRANVTDDNAVQAFSAKASLTAAGLTPPEVLLPGLATAVAIGPNDSTPLPDWRMVQVPLGPGNNEIWFELQATDDAGTIVRSTVHYTIDEIPPVISIDSPTPGSWVAGNSTTFSGVSSDNTGQVHFIYVWLGPAAATPPADITTWNVLNGNAAWATTLPVGGEGAYKVWAVAVDYAGNQSLTASCSFYMDQGNPTLTETTIGPTPAYRNAPFSLDGTAADTNALANITITQRKDGGPVTTALNQPLSGVSQSWSLPITDTDGTFEYAITLTDIAGKTAPVLSRTVILDTAKPIITLTSLTPVIGTDTVNGKVTLSAAVSDGTALDKVWYRYGDTAPFTEITTNKTTPTLLIDTTNTTDFPDMITTNVCLRASDLAGNIQDFVQPLAVNQSSDSPVTSLINLDAARNTPALAAGNLLESNAKVVGSVSDDDGVDADTIEISIDDDATFVPVGQKTASGKVVSFEHNLNGLSEGVHFIHVRASDLAAAKSGLLPVSTDIGRVYFAIDRNPPALAVTSPAAGGLYNADFTLSGTASDANGLQGDVVLVKNEGGAVMATAPVVAGAWSAVINAGTLSQDAKNWTVETTDNFVKTTSIPYAFTVDRTGPSVTISTPAAGSWNTGATLSAIGTASDPNGVISIEWSTDTSTWNAASGTTNWSVILNLLTLGEGSKTLSMRGKDAAQNVSASVSVSFGVDQTPPDTTETSIGSSFAGRSALFELSGSATDTNSLKSILIEQRKDAGSWVTVYSDGSLIGSLAPWTVPAASLPRNPGAADPSNPASALLADGTYEYRITIQDVANNPKVLSRTVRVDLTPPSAAIGDPAADAVLVGAAYSVSGTATDGTGSGVASVYWWAGNFGDTPPAGLGSWNLATGTTNWNALLSLNALGEGKRTLHVKAVDVAGNETPAAATVSFFIDQAPPVVSMSSPATGAIFSAGFTASGNASDANLSLVRISINGGAFASATGTASWTYAVSLASLAVGANTIMVEADDIAGRTATQSITVYRDQSAPVLAFNNLESDGSSVLMESAPKLIGSVSDASGVAGIESYIESWSYASSSWNPVPVQTWTALGAPSNAQVFNWQKDLGPSGLDLPEGRYRITLRASDIAGPTPNQSSGVPGTPGESVAFRIDRSNPALALTAPGQGSFQRADFTAGGTSSDANTISTVKVKVDSSDFTTGATTASTSDGFAAWNAAVSSASLTAGSHTLYVQATDGTGRTTLLTRDFTFDNTPPTLGILTPLSGTSVNGSVAIKGTSADANAVSSVELKIGKDTVWNTLSGVYSWEYDFTNIDTYANSSYADETSSGSGVWQLVVHLRATDAAGNVGTVSSYFIYLDPSMDTPIVTVYQPLDNQTVGGATRVYGIATDDDAVYRVEMQIDLNNDGDFSDQSDYWNYSGTGTPTLAPDGDTNDRFEKEDVWYPVSGTTNWFQVINEFGEYNAATSGDTRTIQIRVRAVDTKNGSDPGTAGNYVQMSITFDNTVPIIENVALDSDALDNGNEVSYSTGLRVAGTFWIVATVKDDSGIFQIERVEQGPLSGSTQIRDDGSITTYLGYVGGYYTYKVRFPVDTLAIPAFVDTSGSYAVSLKATDNTSPSHYVTFSYLNVQVDNFYPTAAYTGNVSQVQGTNYKIQGTGTDVGVNSGIVQGVDRIVAYFVKAGQVYNPLAGGPGNHIALSGSLTLRDASTDDSLKPVAYPSNGTYRVTIDKMTEVGVSDGLPNGDLDGYLESLTVSGNTYDWWSEVDTTHLPDGPIEVHYVVFDKAGNGRHYMQTLYVRNNAPGIDSIVLGTDLNGDGSIGDIVSGESLQFVSGYGATNFVVRNNRLAITVNASAGNGTKRYSMMYGGTEKNGTLTGNTVTITDFTGMPDTAANAAVFSITVFDSTISDDADPTGELTQLGAPLLLRMTIDNIDNTNPSIAAAAFGQKYTLPNPNTDLGKTLVAVSDYNENIVMSGPTRRGHVEYAADSLINGTDADVSGRVIFKGKAWDDQRIQKITATITNYDPDGGGPAGAGAEFIIASWGGSGLTPGSSVSPYWAFSLNSSSEAVTENNGHVLNWDFAWDSSQMAGGAGHNQTVTFTIYDFGPSGGNTSTSAVSVDVVPYITDIQRGAGVNTNRTKYGRYPVQAGETGLVVNGFNLPSSTTQDANNWVRVYDTGGTAFDPTTLTAAAGAARTSVTLTLPAATRSGVLRVSVNGFPDGNRQNNNTKTYDKEDDGSGLASTLWTDDRYLHLWTVNQSFMGSDGAQYPSMSIMGDGTLYGAWINYATSLLTYGTTGAGPVTQFGIYDPPEYTDINVDASEAALKYALAFAANHYGGAGWGNPPLDVASAGFIGVRTPNARVLDTGYPNAIAYPIESLNLNQQLWQFNRPKVVRSNGGVSDALDRIHAAYYDSNTKAVKYSFMLDDGQATVRGWVVLDGGTDAQDVRYVTGIGTRPLNTTLNDPALAGNAMIANGQAIMLMDTAGNSSWTTISAGAGTGTLTLNAAANTARTHYTIVTATSNLVTNGVAQSASAGDYMAIDVDEEGLPVVVYYNTAAQTLRMARANKVNPTSPADWTRQDVFPGGDPNSQFSGQHVAIKFDSGGNLHVVCYRTSTGDLVYLYAPATVGGAAYTFQSSVIVDSVGAVGTWADISLEGAVPHVSYMNGSMIGTFDGIKYATLRPITTNLVGSSTTTSVTSATLVGNTDVAAGQTIVFSDGSSRLISAFIPGSGQVSWGTPLGSAPGVGTILKIVSSTEWENEIAPASQSVTDQRTNIEVKRGAAAWGDVAIGYRSYRFELMYGKPEQ